MKTNKFLSFICSFCLLLSCFLSAVDFWCFNNSFYAKEYKQLKTAESIGMSEEDLNKATDVLLSYLKDRDNTLDVEANINGVNRQVFNQRESDHMIDVRNLYLGAMAIRNISIVITVISLIVLIIRKGINHLYNGFLKALGLYGLFFLVLGTFALIDFNSFWTAFHHVFFPMNDLWLLDPRTDILIMMVPEKFFFDLVFSIIITIISILLITWIVLKELDKRIFNHA